MKTLIINGSPRIDGNSDFIVQHLIEKFRHIVELSEWKLRESDIKFCDGCEACSRSNKNVCSKNDFFTENTMWMSHFDAFLIVTPVYQGGVTAQTKVWMDRCEVFRLKRKLKEKLCGGITTAGFSGGGQELTLMQIQSFAHISCMHYVASWGETRSHFGGYCIAGARQEVQSDIEGLKSCENVLSNMIAFFNRNTRQ